MNIVITGSSRGLGKAMAEIFASHGHRLFLCSQRASPLEETTRELKGIYPDLDCRAKAFDLSDRGQAALFGDWVLEQGLSTDPAFSVDILINNAGRFYPGKLQTEPQGTLENLMAINLYSAYYVTRALLPNMVKNQKGHIFNICSIASLQAYPNGGAYGISKFALAGFSKNLREETKLLGIKVTAVYPGAVYTDSWAGSGVPPSRIMAASDIAAMVYAATQVSDQALVEDIILRPLLGDL